MISILHPGRVAMSAYMLFCCMDLLAQDYGATMEASVKSVFGKNQFRHYEWISYPTNNFGVMTMFIVEKQGKEVEPKDQECATFRCLGVKPEEMKSLTVEQIKSANGYADTGDGASITLSNDQKRSLTLSAVLPRILSVLNLSGNIDKTTGIKATLTLGPATIRFLAKDSALKYIESLPNDSRIHQAYRENRLAIVVSDVMLSSMDISLEVDKTLNSGLAADLNSKI